jgi:hypothetical protein
MHAARPAGEKEHRMDDQHTEGCAAVNSFSRPRYFYGQLLDVRHFESEQEYFKRKLWMLNRMVSGYGVVCGLDVQVAEGDRGVVVMPGLALDKCGREIVVPCRSKTVVIDPVPPKEPGPQYGDKKDSYKEPPYKESGYKDNDDYREDDWVHLVICFREQRTDPEPVLAGGCDDTDRCAPGAVREGYELRLVPGRAPDISVDPSIPNLIKGNSLNYRALVEWVSAPCDEHSGTCVTLANIRRPSGDNSVELSDIDISVRPLVYSLDLLWELFLSLTHDTQSRRTGKH